MFIGAQLYTIREFTKTEEDFKKSMERIAGIGYKYVQISAVGPMPASKIRQICDDNGLSIILTHTKPDLILNSPDQVIEDHKEMSAGYVGLGAMPFNYLESGLDGVKKFIADYTPSAEKFKAAGLKFMYHNHHFEFVKINGKLIMDYLVEGFPADLAGFTLDTYWVQAGGSDPALWLEKLAGRLDTIHFKDFQMLEFRKSGMAEVMEGNLNWPSIFEACKKAGSKWAFVEQDDCNGKDPFECLKTSFDNLSKVNFD